MPGADVFVGLSGPDLITVDDVRSMAPDPVVFAMANPDPEIRPEMIQGRGSGHSQWAGRTSPNQINKRAGVPRGLLGEPWMRAHGESPRT